MKLKKYFFFVIVPMFAIVACGKSGSNPSPSKTDTIPVVVTPPVVTPAADIYILGTTAAGNVFWKNGTATVLNGFAGYTCTGIAVSGTDVYVAGTLKTNGVNTAAYWKNGKVTTLSVGSRSTEATGIAVSGTDVYVSGFTDQVIAGGHIQSNYIAYYWKNGNAVSLSDTTLYGRGSAITVDNNNVYVAGASGYFAVYWKNGIETKLSDGSTLSSAIAINVSKGDVYAAGSVTINNSNTATKGVYWKNGTAVTITDPGLFPMEAFTVSGSDVYNAGYATGPNLQNAGYWKNNVVTVLPAPTISTNNNLLITGIAVNGTDVYVTENNGYWKNTSYVPLADCTGTAAIAVVVK